MHIACYLMPFDALVKLYGGHTCIRLQTKWKQLNMVMTGKDQLRSHWGLFPGLGTREHGWEQGWRKMTTYWGQLSLRHTVWSKTPLRVLKLITVIINFVVPLWSHLKPLESVNTAQIIQCSLFVAPDVALCG